MDMCVSVCEIQSSIHKREKLLVSDHRGCAAASIVEIGAPPTAACQVTATFFYETSKLTHTNFVHVSLLPFSLDGAHVCTR